MRTKDELTVLRAKFDRDMEKRSRFNRFMLSIDQTINVLWLNGSQDETCSSYIGRKKENGTSTVFQEKVCCLLNRLEYNHCSLSVGE